MATRSKAALVAFCLASSAWFTSCSSQPAGPRMGSPEWYWAAAREQFAAGDLTKTQEHLEKLMATDNPFKERAATWHLVVLSGMANGYRDLADAYEDGGKQSKSPGDFRRIVSDMQRSSRQFAIVLAEEAGRFTKEMSGAEQFTLDFGFPSGNANESPTIERVRKGIFPAEPDRLSAQRQALARELVLTTAKMSGSGDAAKAAERFKTPPVQVPRATFLLALADSLVEESVIFDRKRSNEPDKKKIMLQLAADCLKPAAGGDASAQKKAKEIQARIEKEQKALDKKG